MTRVKFFPIFNSINKYFYFITFLIYKNLIKMCAQADDLLWKLIGENEFCSYKYKTKFGFLCRNNLNLIGVCSRQFCPLSNSRYATVINQGGFFFLFKKENNNFNRPEKIWRKILLSRSFVKAIQEINFNLALWPKFFLHHIKKRFIKLTQIFYRNRLKFFEEKNPDFLKNVFDSKIKIDSWKIETNLKIEKTVEHELLNRLNLGTYGKLYFQFPIQKWKKSTFQKTSDICQKKSIKSIMYKEQEKID